MQHLFFTLQLNESFNIAIDVTVISSITHVLVPSNLYPWHLPREGDEFTEGTTSEKCDEHYWSDKFSSLLYARQKPEAAGHCTAVKAGGQPLLVPSNI